MGGPLVNFPESDLGPPQSDDEIRENFHARALEVGEGVRCIKEVEWLVDGLLPKGCLILFAGQAKHGRKSLMMMELSRCVAMVGQNFLDQDTDHGQVIFVNLEDGEDRVMRRFYHFGMRSHITEARFPIYTVTSGEYLDLVLAYIQTFKPQLVVIDPLIEWVIEAGIENENDAKEIANMLKPLRKLAQETQTAIMVVHHFRKSGDEMRGSSALQGACDGWWNIYRRKGKPHLLRFILRDGPEGEIPIEINYEDKVVSIAAAGDISEISEDEPNEEKRENGSSRKTDRLSEGEARRRILLELQAHPEQSYNLRLMREAVGCKMSFVQSVVGQLLEEKIIVQKGRRWVINPEYDPDEGETEE